MNNDIDSWLQLLGINQSPQENQSQSSPSPSSSSSSSSPQSEPPSHSPSNVSQPSSLNSQPPTQSSSPVLPSPLESSPLSNQDFDDILNDLGFPPQEEAQAEEILEDSPQPQEPPQPEPPSEPEPIQPTLSTEPTTPTEPSEPTAPTPSPPAPLQDFLPLNSPTLLLDDSTSRFSGAEWYNEIQSKSIILAGCGGIGSWLSLQLARMNPAALLIYDDDTVETINMAGQLYALNDIGKPKVTALYNTIHAYTKAHNVYGINEKFTASTEAGKIMMCGFDNMAARRTFFESWHNCVEGLTEEDKARCLFLDGRLSMDTLQVFCITGNDEYNKQRYLLEYLFDDSEADETQCSMKQTTYLACMIGSIMTNLFTNFCADLLNPAIPYDLPFFTEYDAQNMIFRTVR